VIPCAVRIVHVETRSMGLLVEPQNQGLRFVSGLASKPLGRFSPVWPQKRWQRFVSSLASKPLGRFSPVWPQNRWSWFSPIWPQNWWLKFPGLGLKTSIFGLVIWVSKSPRRFLGLGLKTKQASVCRFRHKTDRGRTAWDTHRDLAAIFT
jgi:hypothetical protein